MANQLWQKRVLIPFWTVQLLVVAILLVLFSLSVAVVNEYQDYADDYGADRISRPVHRAFNIVAAVFIGICALTITFDLAEIILVARNRLSAQVAVASNTIITVVWVVMLILQIVGAVGSATGSPLGFLFIVIVVATALGKLIYSSVIFHRYRTAGRFAARGTYSSAPANAEVGGVASFPAPAPLNPFRDQTRNPSPAAGSHRHSGAAGESYRPDPSYEMQQTAAR